MRTQILVAVGALVFNFAHPSSANPLHHTIIGLATIESVGVAEISTSKLGAPLSERDEWITNLGNGWASYVQTWESYIRTQFPNTVCCYSVVTCTTERVSKAICSIDMSYSLTLTQEWRMEMLTLIISTAVHLAAWTLAKFYSMILDRAQGGPQNLGNPSLFMAFEWNDLRLEFSSDAGTIPWELVAAFAARMVSRTQAGFTGQFNAVYVHMATEQSIRISLMILQDVATERTGQNY